MPRGCRMRSSTQDIPITANSPSGARASKGKETSRRGSDARRGLKEPRRQAAAVRQDRDDLLGQRETARTYTASTLGSGSAGDRPSGDGYRHSRRHLFGRRSASPQAARSAPAADSHPAPDVPAGASAPAE